MATYDEILGKMGMAMAADGKRVVLKSTATTATTATSTTPAFQPNPHPQISNSAIYNKYFSSQAMKSPYVAPKRPTTLPEYAQMVLDDVRERERIKRVKSKKIIYW